MKFFFGVTARFGPKDAVPVTVLREWIDESYRAVAPRGMAVLVDSPPEATRRRRARR